jgi:hypothetical protein
LILAGGSVFHTVNFSYSGWLNSQNWIIHR